MTLREWIATAGLTQRAAAERLGVHEITLNRWLTGRAIPRRDQMTLIGTMTDGAVLPNSFYWTGPDSNDDTSRRVDGMHETASKLRSATDGGAP